jgi:hypothetical protein
MIFDEFDVEDSPQGLIDNLQEYSVNYDKNLDFKIID